MNGCFNRADFVSHITQQDGWHYSPDGQTKVPKLVQTPHRMSKGCHYSVDPMVGSKDKACTGCPRIGT